MKHAGESTDVVFTLVVSGRISTVCNCTYVGCFVQKSAYAYAVAEIYSTVRTYSTTHVVK